MTTHVPAQAFDELAAGYDATFTNSIVGRALRELVWLRFEDSLSSCQRVLDLGCGTGEDAVRLARGGVNVVATDASSAMIRIARQKASAAGCAQRIEFHCCAIEDFVSRGTDTFDGVLSNFGAVNCVRDLPALAAAVASRLAPGGRLLWVVMGKHVPWEWMWYLVRGRWRKAWRRLSCGGATWRGVIVSYPAPAEVVRALAPAFVVNRISPLGVALPPSYAAAWLERAPRAFGLLSWLERCCQSSRALASIADHYIIEATRS